MWTTMMKVLESEIPKADWLQSKYDQLCMPDEKRLKACITFKITKGGFGKLLTRK